MNQGEIVRYRNADFFTLTNVLSDKVMVGSADGSILAYESDAGPERSMEVDLGGLNVAPGLIDLQVNGAEGIWVYAARHLSEIAQIDVSLAHHGITRWCPTYISPTSDEIANAARLAREAADSRLGVIAWHLEGPWINVERRGAHPPERVRPLSDADVYNLQIMSKYSRVVVTLAPELAPAHFVAELTSFGITVLAGHTNARFDDYEKFFEAGGAGLTHIGNASNLLESRQSFGWGALIHSPRKFATVIADGHHVDSTVLRIIKRSLNRHQLIAVSDMVAGSKSTEAKFDFFSESCVRSADGSARTIDGRLAGSLSNLFQGLRFLVQRCGIPLDEAVRMCTTYPAALLGLSATYGSLNEGSRCDMVAFSNYFVIHRVYRDGICLFESS
jgi:N-acetylglucosamine-6-phosphate deacetylase